MYDKENGCPYGEADDLMASLPQQVIDRIYRVQHQIYWEADFVGRCIDRMLEGSGPGSLPYESLPEETELLNAAYGIYNRVEDRNVAYNDTLDAVIDEIGKMVSSGIIKSSGKGAYTP